MTEYKGVMVYCEIEEGKLASITTEILGGGRRLADELGEELSAVLLGSGVGDLAQEVIAFGADNVYVTDDVLLKTYETDAHLAVMEKVVNEAKPKVLILGQTSIGRDLAPRLAFRLETTVTMDCIELAIDPETKQLQQTKPVYGGNARVIFTGETYPQIVTARTKTMAPLEKDASRMQLMQKNGEAAVPT